MFFTTLVSLGLAAVQSPPPPRSVQYRSHDVAAALKAGCRVQQVHTPAAKSGSQRPILRCPGRIKHLESAAINGR